MDTTLAERVVLRAAGLLVEVLKRVVDDLGQPLRCQQSLLGVDGRHLLVRQAGRDPDGVDVVDAERQDVLVADGINDRVGMDRHLVALAGRAVGRVAMQEAAEGLSRGPKLRVAAAPGVDGEDRRAGEAEQVVPLERLGDRRSACRRTASGGTRRR